LVRFFLVAFFLSNIKHLLYQAWTFNSQVVFLKVVSNLAIWIVICNRKRERNLFIKANIAVRHEYANKFESTSAAQSLSKLNFLFIQWLIVEIVQVSHAHFFTLFVSKKDFSHKNSFLLSLVTHDNSPVLPLQEWILLRMSESWEFIFFKIRIFDCKFPSYGI
jgi:hypothetical protein